MAKAAKKAAKKPAASKAVKKPKKAKETKAEPAEQKAAVSRANAPKADPKMRELARHHADKYRRLKEAQNKANRAMQALGKEVKGDGLTMRQIKLMVELSTPEGEAAWRMTIANDLIAAQYQGAAIGQQLVLFLEPDRTPSVDIAYDEGVQDSIDGKTANPGYDPSVPQHASYMKGYHEETERRIKAGIKPTEPAEDKTRGEVLAAARAANEKPAVTH